MAKPIDLSVITGVKDAVKYPSEQKAPTSTKLQKNLPGRILTGERVRIDADKTTLFQLNPRNFSGKNDISDLKPLIIRTGGNSTAVDARLVDGRIEVIAGSRRRQACLETGLKLTCDVWDEVSDEEACLIAELENSGRSDIDFMGFCSYLATRYELLKKATPDLTMERFGEFYNLTRQYMHEKIAIGRLPAWLKESAKIRTGADWSHRQGVKLASAYSELHAAGVDIQKALTKAGSPFSTPTLALSFLISLRDEISGTSANDLSKTPLELIVGGGSIVVEETSKGLIKIQGKSLAPEARAAIIEFLRSLGSKS